MLHAPLLLLALEVGDALHHPFRSGCAAQVMVEELIEEVEGGNMPLGSYKLTHTDARLTPAEIKALTDWAASVRENLPTK